VGTVIDTQQSQKRTTKHTRTHSTKSSRRNNNLVSHRLANRDITFAWPIERSQFWLSSFFGPRRGGFHRGIDMAAIKGTKVKSAGAGTVIEAGYIRGYGKRVVVLHSPKYKTRYAHLDTIKVKVGQKVETGTLLGTVGSTGHTYSVHKSDASHLHFEVCIYGKQINPLYFLV
jgi:murein DD-endopeptidase MepM/ murein hydrolase activator NlpD